MKLDIVKGYVAGWDNAPPEGERAALSIWISPAQHAATLRANNPPGDAEGQQILEDLAAMQVEFVLSNPGGVTTVCVFNGTASEMAGWPVPASLIKSKVPDVMVDSNEFGIRCPHCKTWNTHEECGTYQVLVPICKHCDGCTETDH